MKLFELKLDACISCNTSIVDARNLMRSISRAIVKRIINAAATLTKIQPVYPPIKSQLESRRSVWRARCPRIDAKADKWPVKTRGRGSEKGNYTMSASVNGAVVAIFRCAAKLCWFKFESSREDIAISKFISFSVPTRFAPRYKVFFDSPRMWWYFRLIELSSNV